MLMAEPIADVRPTGAALAAWVALLPLAMIMRIASSLILHRLPRRLLGAPVAERRTIVRHLPSMKHARTRVTGSVFSTKRAALHGKDHIGWGVVAIALACSGVLDPVPLVMYTDPTTAPVSRRFVRAVFGYLRIVADGLHGEK